LKYTRVTQVVGCGLCSTKTVPDTRSVPGIWRYPVYGHSR